MIRSFGIATVLVCGLAGLPQVASAQDRALIATGKETYAENCSPCHGDNLRNPGSSFDLKELHESERERFNTSVMEGKGQMPPWRGTLGPDDLDALWAYIRANAYD